MESKIKHERFSRLESVEKHKLPAKAIASRYKSISPYKARSVSPREKRLANLSFDAKQWSKDIEKINKQEQAILKAIKELNSKYNAAKARIQESKRTWVKRICKKVRLKKLKIFATD